VSRTPTRTPSKTPTKAATRTPTRAATATRTRAPTKTPTRTRQTSALPTATIGGDSYRIVRAGRSAGSAPANLAFDGDPTTVWITDPAGDPPEDGFIYVDLGSSKSIGSVRWMFGVDGAADQWHLQISRDRRTWTTVAEFGNAPTGTWQEQPVGAKARYVRFYFLNPNGDGQIGGVAEIEVWP
jgi:hypothetical protein